MLFGLVLKDFCRNAEVFFYSLEKGLNNTNAQRSAVTNHNARRVSEGKQFTKGKKNMEERNLLDMNLQFFAEETPEQQEDAPKTTDEEQQNSEPKQENPKNEPSVQELLVEVAKQKRAIDKLTKENGELTKKYRATLSEQEQASLQKAEEQAKHDEEFESLKKQVHVNELTENYMDLGYSKDLAKKAATAQVDGDTESLLEIQKQFNETQQKKWEADFLKKMPAINTGNGGSNAITKEQFDKMTLVEKSKLRRENKAEYDRLIAL